MFVCKTLEERKRARVFFWRASFKYPGVRKVLFSACSASYRALGSNLPVLTGMYLQYSTGNVFSTCNRLYSCTGTVSSPLANTVQGPCTCKVPFSDCRTGHIQHMRVGVCLRLYLCLCVCVCVCVCVCLRSARCSYSTTSRSHPRQFPGP